jgi:membrane protein DedA with SNARE-associated domain
METTLPFLEHFPLLALFILLLLGGIGLPIPEDATLILCGVLIANEVIRPILALATVYIGLLIADMLLFHIGRKFGRAIVMHKRFHRFLSQYLLTRLEERFRKNGFLFVLFGRHLVGLRAQVFLVAGVMAMPFTNFLAADAVSALGTIALMVGIGYAGGSSLEIIRKDMARIEHVALVIALAALTGYLLFRYFHARRSMSR